MKRYEFTRIAILSFWILALSAFRPVDAQTQRVGSQARNRRTAAPTVRFASRQGALKIPLEIDNNIILLRVSVNGSRPLKFIFDTGASHTVIDAKRAIELGLKTHGQASGTATGGAIQVSFIRGVSLSVLGAEVSNQSISSMAFPTIPGFEFDGVIGYNFINQFVVEIDYLNKFMNLYNPRTYAYGGKEKAIPLLIEGGLPFVRTKVVLEGRAPFEAKLEVDTGADGTFILNSSFVKKHGLAAIIQNTVPDRGVGAGGEQGRVLGQVKAAHLGRFILKDPPLALVLDAKAGSADEEMDGVVGGEIFRRFKVILNYRQRKMILEPNKSFNDPYKLEVGG